MLPEVESADYHGANTWDEVRPHLGAAVAAVREVIGFNEPEGEAQVVDAAYGFSGGIEASGSVRLGSLTIEQGQGGGYDAAMDRAVRRALSGSGLLYQGLG